MFLNAPGLPFLMAFMESSGGYGVKGALFQAVMVTERSRGRTARRPPRDGYQRSPDRQLRPAARARL